MAGSGAKAALKWGMVLALAAVAACAPKPKELPLENFTAEEIFKRGELEGRAAVFPGN